MGQLGDDVGAVTVEITPVSAQVGRAAEVFQAAVDGGRVAVVRKDVLGLVDQPEGHDGGVGQVDVQRAVEALAGVGVVVDFAVGVGAGDDRTAAHAPLLVERAGQVGFQVIGVPAAVAPGQAALEFAGRALAHHVDDAAHLAGAVEQPGRPAHDLDPIERRQRRQRTVDAGHRRGQAIDVEFVVLVAARIDRRAPAVVAQGAQAG